MHSDAGTFKARDGLRLFDEVWRPEGNARALIVIVHGYAEHSSRYRHAAEYLTHRGYAVHAFDLRGHGRSEGTRAFVRSFDEYLSDLDSFLFRVRNREPGKLIFLLGHSMGGTIVTLFAITRKPDVRGLILSGPLLKVPGDISPFLIGLASVLGQILPKAALVKKVDSSLLSRDPKVVTGYEHDGLVYRGRMPAREAAEINRALNRILARMDTVTLPLLILHGTADRLVDIEGSKELYACAASTDKTLKLYEGFYHELLNEPDKEAVLKDIVDWTDAHII